MARRKTAHNFDLLAVELEVSRNAVDPQVGLPKTIAAEGSEETALFKINAEITFDGKFPAIQE